MSAAAELAVIEDISEEKAPSIYVQHGLKPYLQAIRDEVCGEVPDLSTRKGRERIASLAATVSKRKVAVEKPGREYLRSIKELPKIIEAELREFVKEADALRDEIRKPLTDWEEAEKSRVERIEGQVKRLGDTDVTDMSASDIRQTIENLDAHVIDARYEEFESEAHRVKAASLSALREALAKQEQHESEQAELAELRRKQAEQGQKDREAQIAREATERAQREAEQQAQAELEAAVKREADAKAASERRELELRLEAEAAQRRELEAKQRAEQAERDAEAQAERAAQAERQRQADEQARIAREAKAREADREHKGNILRAAKEAVMKAGVSEDQARDIVKLIASGHVPNVSISY